MLRIQDLRYLFLLFFLCPQFTSFSKITVESSSSLLLYSDYAFKMTEALKIENLEEAESLSKGNQGYLEQYLYENLHKYFYPENQSPLEDLNVFIPILISLYNKNTGHWYFNDLWEQYKNWTPEEKKLKRSTDESFLSASHSSEPSKVIENCLEIYEQLGDSKGIYDCKLSLIREKLLNSKFDKMNESALWNELSQIISLYGKPSDYSEMRSLKAIQLLSKGDIQNSLSELEIAASEFKKLGDPLGRARIQLQKGEIYSKTGYFEKAQNEFQEALQVFKTSGLDEEHASISTSLGNLALRQKDPEVAERYFEDALAIYERLTHSGGQAKVLNNLGVVYGNKNKDEEALKSFLKSIEIARSSSNNLQLAETSNNLGGFHLKKGANDMAIMAYKEAISAAKKCGASDVEIKTLHNMGLAYYLSGNKENALSCLNESLSFSRKNTQDSDALETSFLLGKIYQEQKNSEKMKYYLTLALDYSKKLGYDSKITEIEKILKSAG